MEAKQSVIENIAPVLTGVFTPLFAVMLLAAVPRLPGVPASGDVDRDLLIVFDVCSSWSCSACCCTRISPATRSCRPVWFDRLQLVIVVAAIVVDLLVLVSMLARIGEFGFTAEPVAALGLNLILLVNLAWSAGSRSGFLPRPDDRSAARALADRVPAGVRGGRRGGRAVPPIFGFV